MAASTSTSTPPDPIPALSNEHMAVVDLTDSVSSTVLLAEIAASLKSLRDHSDRFMQLLDIEEEESTRHTRNKGEMPEGDIVSGSDAAERRSRRRSRGSSRNSKSVSDFSNTPSHDGTEEDLETRQSTPNRRNRSRPTSAGRAVLIVEERRVHRASSWRNSRRRRPSTQSSTSDSSSRHSARSITSDGQFSDATRPRLDAYKSVEVGYGGFPNPDLFEQLFGESCVRDDRLCFDSVDDDAAIASWLDEKHFIFAPDERCRFVFDMGTLASLRGLGSVEAVFEYIGQFSRDLRAQGGFFFFRESYNHGLVANKIYNGTHVFSCRDGFKQALPRISGSGKSFSEEIPEERPAWGEWGEDMWLRQTLEARKEESRWSHGPRDLHVTYHYDGEPRHDYDGGRPTGVVTDDGMGHRTELTEGCDVYTDPHLTAPWRRLWYAKGLVCLSLRVANA